MGEDNKFTHFFYICCERHNPKHRLMVLNTENILLIGSILLFISIIASKGAHRFGVPVMLLFLGVGMVFGSDGVGIQFNSAATAQFIGIIALCFILFSGGMDTKIPEIRPVVVPGLVLSSFGVILTTLIMGFAIFYLSRLVPGFVILTLAESMLLAAILSSTDSATVFSILRSRGLKLKQNLRPLLELESGSNDPMAYMLMLLLIGVVKDGEMNTFMFISNFITQFGIGAISGYLLGKVFVFVINLIKLPRKSQFHIFLLVSVFFTYSFTELFHGNGFLAVYMVGLIIGNSNVKQDKAATYFFDGIAWLCELVMFLTLGLLVIPSELINVAAIGLLISAVMLTIARPAAVFLSLLPFSSLDARAKHYISWVGLKGAVPIVFATYPLVAGLENSQLIFNIVFFTTIISLIVQGTSVNFAAQKLKLVSE